jgi:hypothetical protein
LAGHDAGECCLPSLPTFGAPRTDNILLPVDGLIGRKVPAAESEAEPKFRRSTTLSMSEILIVQHSSMVRFLSWYAQWPLPVPPKPLRHLLYLILWGTVIGLIAVA